MIGLALALAASTANWREYHNDRFGFTVCYPAALLRAGSESGSGDGKTFASSDGAELRTFGEFYYDDNATMLRRLRTLDRELAADGARVTYAISRPARGNRPAWGVRSGYIGSKVFYYKVVEVDGKILDFQFTYPSSNSGKWKGPLERMVSCF